MIEGPASGGTRGSRGAAALEDLAEQPLARAACQKHVLARRVVIAVAGRYGDSFDSERHRLVEEFSHMIRILAAEQGAVDGDAEAPGTCQADGHHRLVIHTFLAYRLVMTLPVAVQMDREGQIR